MKLCKKNAVEGKRQEEIKRDCDLRSISETTDMAKFNMQSLTQY